MPQHHDARARRQGPPGVCAVGPPRQAPLRASLPPSPVTLAVLQPACERRARAVAQDVDGALKRMIAQGLSAHRGESIHALADIDRLRGQNEAAWGCELQQEGASKKARTNAASGTVDSAPWRHRRAPSVRCRATWVPPGGAGRSGMLGPSTQPRGKGDGGGVSRGAMAICFVRSWHDHRQCWATREWGRTRAQATACSHNPGGMRSRGVRVWRQCSNWPAHWSSWCSACNEVLRVLWPPRHWVPFLRMTVGYGKARFTQAGRKHTHDTAKSVECLRRDEIGKVILQQALMAGR